MHHANLKICLAVCIFCFLLCAVGIVTPLSNFAVMMGTFLILVMTCGFFYATLHLQKIK